MRNSHVVRATNSRCFAALLFSSTLSIPLHAASEAPSPAPAAETVNLPALNVTDTRELPAPEKWRYTQITGFEVISSASDRETRKLLRDFEIFRMALGIAWPMEPRPTPPSAMILCGRAGEFKAHIPVSESTEGTGRTSLTLNNQEQAFLVMDLGTKIIGVDVINADADADLSGPITFEVDHYKQLYREYVRYLFSLSPTRPQAWLEEGISQIVMSMEFDKRTVIFGKIDDPNTISAAQENANALNTAAGVAGDTSSPTARAPVEDRDFNAALKRRSLLPFDEFFGVSRDSDTARNPLGNNIWAKQCYAFVHMCRYQMGKPYKKAFETFVARTAREPATEALFLECFGKPYKKFLTELSGYIYFTDYKYDQFKITGEKTLEAPPPEMRDATEGEAMRIRGDASRLAGNAAAARNSLVAAYIRGERGPPFLSTLAQAELAAGNTERGRKFLEAAAPKSTRPSVLIDLARLRFEEARRASKDGIEKKLDDAQLEAVLKPLFVARALPPARPEAYELIALAWLHAETPPKPEQTGVLAEGLKIFPRRVELVHATALLFARIGNAQAARALAEHGEKVAADDAGRARFTQLKANLPPLPAHAR